MRRAIRGCCSRQRLLFDNSLRRLNARITPIDWYFLHCRFQISENEVTLQPIKSKKTELFCQEAKLIKPIINVGLE
jgi:hypothetical protein|tara:strand:- start:814 stop:1041 length:228 start_codon:yes stop_codon:yes gene_type:complete